MKTELKKAIISYMFENEKAFQLYNQTVKTFKQYIYDPKGEYIIGGEEVCNFISISEKLIKL